MIKHTLIVFLTISAQCTISAQTSTRNYVKIRSPRIECSNMEELDQLSWEQTKTEIVYLDALGRVAQAVDYRTTSTGNSIVQPFKYDEFGLQTKYYESYSTLGTLNNLDYRPNWLSELHNFYSSNESNGITPCYSPYVEVAYSKSPEQRLELMGAVGSSWSLASGRVSQQKFGVELASDKVIRWMLDESGLPIEDERPIQNYNSNSTQSVTSLVLSCPLLSSQWHYPIGQLEMTPEQCLLYGNTDYEAVYFDGLDPSKTYQIKLKYKRTEGSPLLFYAKFEMNDLLVQEDMLPCEGMAAGIWHNFESDFVTGVNSIKVQRGGGPTGTTSDFFRMKDFEIVELIQETTVSSGPMFYSDQELYKSVVIDENQLITENFYNSLNNLVLSRLRKGENINDTYYVYNEKNQLAAVIPPKYIDDLIADSYIDHYSAGAKRNSMFLYKYDGRGYVNYKSEPDKGVTLFVNNLQGKVMFEQNQLQRDIDWWSFYSYDYQGRLVLKGEMRESHNSALWLNQAYQQNLQSVSGEVGYDFETRIVQSPIEIGYSLNGLQFSLDYQIDEVLYYDTYPPSIPQDLQADDPSNDLMNGLGQVVAQLTKVPSEENRKLLNVTYYDSKGRPVKTAKETLNGSIVSNKEFSWSGDLLIDETIAKWNGETFLSRFRFTYDHRSRLKNCYHKMGSDPEILFSKNEYNELSQVVRKSLYKDLNAQNFLQVIDYGYHERGWLTRINNAELVDDAATNFDDNDVFGEELIYNSTVSGPTTSGFNTALYSGLPQAMLWKVKDMDAPGEELDCNAYFFKYDWLNRLSAAHYRRSNSILNPGYFGNSSYSGSFDENYTYDNGGNILSLTRRNGGDLLDDLTYTYKVKSNKIDFIQDQGSIDLDPNRKHFVTSNSSSSQYEYDTSGNLTADYNKNLFYNYDHKNLLSRVISGNAQDQVEFVRSTSGEKLIKKIGTSSHYYVNGFEFDDSGFLKVSTTEGMVRRRVHVQEGMSEFVYDYFLLDHLSNVRAVVTTEDAPLESSVVTNELQRKMLEESEFDHVESVRAQRPLYMPQDSEFGFNTKASELSVEEGKSIGPSKLLEIKSGESYDITTRYWYTDVAPNSIVNDLPGLISGISGSILTQASNVLAGGENIVTNLVGSGSGMNSALSSFLTSEFATTDFEKPYSYLVYITFNKDFVMDTQRSGSLRVRTMNSLETLEKTKLDIERDGFLFVYLVNGSLRKVYFDNLQITRRRPKILQKMDYYPYGLQWENRNQNFSNNAYGHTSKEMQDNEWQDKGLDWEDFGARMYDPVIGRWWSVDPLAEKFKGRSPYEYTFGNPINLIDPTGLEPERIYNVTMNDGTIVQKEIDDGVNETVDIAEQDFNQLQQLYNNAPNKEDNSGNTIKDLSQYENHYDRLAIGTKGYDIALTARGYEYSFEWSYSAKKGNFGENTYKCNKFVQDVLSENGAAPNGTWPPLAGAWANKKVRIAGWTIVSEAHLGDVIAGGYPYSDASGHVVIVTGIDPDTGYITSMGTVNSTHIGDSGFANALVNNKGVFRGKTYNPIGIRRFIGQ